MSSLLYAAILSQLNDFHRKGGHFFAFTQIIRHPLQYILKALQYYLDYSLKFTNFAPQKNAGCGLPAAYKNNIYDKTRKDNEERGKRNEFRLARTHEAFAGANRKKENARTLTLPLRHGTHRDCRPVGRVKAIRL